MELKHVVLWRDKSSRNANAVIRGVPGMSMESVGGAEEPSGASVNQVEVARINVREAKDLARDPAVAIVAPVMPMRLIEPMAVNVTADPLANNTTWGVKAVRADTSPRTGAGVVVAVLDTGIDPTHPAFAGVQLVRNNFTTSGPDDDHGHGTHCAGTIFGRDVNGTRIGIARGVTKALIGKVLGTGGGGSDIVAQAIFWAATNGAHVISMSLGIDFPGFVHDLSQQVPVEAATSLALEGYRANVKLFESLASLLDAQSLLTGHPTLLVAAAGNESARRSQPSFEIAVSPPAIATGIVSVAALQDQGGSFTVADFSNTGARVSGPGVAVMSAKRGGGLTSMSGTSMATPHVAGVAALWAQKLIQTNSLTAANLVGSLVGSATQIPMMAPFDPSDIGLGIVQAPQT
jgi:subtilisin family serine protease